MTELTDLELRDERIFLMVNDENRKQLLKWGIQTHTPFEWLTYTTEELGELANAISEYEYRNGSKAKLIREAIQTATLALKIAEMYLNKPLKLLERGNKNDQSPRSY